MNPQAIEYWNGSTRLVGQLFADDTIIGERPGVVVFPEAFGLGEHALQRARRLAEAGYVALAADPHGDGRLYGDLASVAAPIQALYADRAEWRGRARAALDTLVSHPQVDSSRTAAIGYCFGGTTCFELARSGAPLAAIVSFHGGLIPEMPGDEGRIRARVLVCHGAEDPFVKKDGIEAVMAELRRDKLDWQFIYYGDTQHSFTNPDAGKNNIPGLAYKACADRRSWAAMCGLFEEVFDQPAGS